MSQDWANKRNAAARYELDRHMRDLATLGWSTVRNPGYRRGWPIATGRHNSDGTMLRIFFCIATGKAYATRARDPKLDVSRYACDYRYVTTAYLMDRAEEAADKP